MKSQLEQMIECCEHFIPLVKTCEKCRRYPDAANASAQRADEPALRYDADKLRYDLLPEDALEELVRVYTIGAKKYADRNWEKGMSWSRCFGSLMRHAWAFWRGDSHDKETGCHHMAMAAWNCLALCTYHMRRKGIDDRPKSMDILQNTPFAEKSK